MKKSTQAFGLSGSVVNHSVALVTAELKVEGAPMKKTAILFDVDGTLVDSNDAHAKAFVTAFKEVGCEVPYERVRRLIGKGGDKLIQEASGLDPESEKGQAASKLKKEIFRSEYLPQLKPFPGAKTLVEQAKSSGLRLIAASSASKEDLQSLLGIVGAADCFFDATSKDDVESSKPDPDIVLSALEQAQCTPDEAIMIGDTPYDIQAAERAGVDCVAVLTGGWRPDELKGARMIFRDPSEISEHLAELLN